jgi:hypothetical protein|nr:MAG TPA_asm: hypothetical protein [Bacteriophage sp.]
MARAKKESAVEEMKSAVAEKTSDKAEAKPKTVVIQLPVIEGMGDSVYVGVNMKDYQIKRGEPVEVPLCVAEVLRNSDKQMMVAMQRQEELTSKNYGEV